MDIIGDAALTNIQAPAAISADGNSAGIDARNLKGQGAIVLMARNTAGSTPTLALKLQGSQDTDAVTSVTPGSNTGTGNCFDVVAGPDAVAETITLTFSNATTAAVVGSVSGSLGNATVGERFTSAYVAFDLVAGDTAFADQDTIAIVTTARTYADVDGGGFTGLTTGVSTQKRALNFDRLPRYLRMNYDIGGTSSPAYTLAVVALSDTD
jgi:hypothetical protein